MARKSRTLQKIRRRLVYWTVRLAQGLLALLPFDSAIRFGGACGRVAYYLIGREREKTIKHLRQAFGQQKSEKELRAIARDVFVHAGRAVAEIGLLPRWTDERLRNRIEIENVKPVLDLAEKRQGQVVLTAHYGNWELFGLYATRILGLKMGVIARHHSNPHVDREITSYRERMGLKVFFRGDSARPILRHLLDGGTLAILADHDVRRLDGIFVEFFDRPTHALTGPAELIVRTGAPWFLAILERSEDGLRYHGRIEGPFDPPPGKDRPGRVRALIEQYMNRLEEIIRQNPSQWMWMHNRWQRQPETNTSQMVDG